MYEANGIVLTDSEYSELKLLLENRGSLQAFGLHRQGDDDDRKKLYASLLDKRLIEAATTWDGTVIVMDITHAGLSFVHDYERAAEDEDRESKAQRAHDYKVAAFGAVCGTVSGGALGFLGGLFSDQIAGAITQALGI